MKTIWQNELEQYFEPIMNRISILNKGKTKKDLGYLFIDNECTVWNIQKIDGPMYQYGGHSTVKSFGSGKDCLDFLNNMRG